MEYAETYRMGRDSISQRRKTKATAMAVSRVRRMDETSKRRKRNPKGQAEVRSGGNVADAFLRTTFLPKLQQSEDIDTVDRKAVERDFYQSLSTLARRFGIEPMPTQSLSYPYNIISALENAREQLREKTDNWQEIRLVEDGDQAFFAERKNYDTGMTLYYIPVMPLYRMLKSKRHRKAGHLLLSVCTYLYYIADVAYYRHEGCYLNSMYECLMEWDMESDEETDPILLSEYGLSLMVGDIMDRKLRNRENLSRFKMRLDTFRSRDQFDSECEKLAGRFFALYQEYANTPLNRQFLPYTDSDEEWYGETVTFDMYVSFGANNEGLLSDLLVELVNSQIQEYSRIEEPTIYEPIDDREITVGNFKFEERLYTLIDELICLLDEF